tara:strand:- start:315 stop:725 length:411 start_codon:yes stop_codon:yes gene_type:complete
MDVVNKIYLNWEAVENLVTELAISANFKLTGINYIHGIARGGLIPAVMLSHKLKLPYVGSIINLTPSEVLIVDDIADSGHTLKKWSDYKTAVLHYKPHSSIVQPTLWSETHKTDDWIIYPWERQDSKTIQDYKLDK